MSRHSKARQVKAMNRRYTVIVRAITLALCRPFKGLKAFLGYGTVLDASNICMS